MLKSWANRRSGKEKHLDQAHSSSGSGNGSGGGVSLGGAASNPKVFGVALPTDDLASLPKGAYNPKNFIDGIPVIVYKTIRYLYKNGLSTEGLFRIPGSNSEIQELKAKFDAGEDLDLEDTKVCSSPHEAAGLLKLYFRELPDPLLTYDLYDVLQTTISTISDVEEKRKRLRSVVFLLPVVHYETLGCLLKFLKKVTDGSEINKMSSVNLAICLAPNLIKERSSGTGGGFMNTGNTTMIMKTLIDECDYIFEEDQEDVTEEKSTETGDQELSVQPDSPSNKVPDSSTVQSNLGTTMSPSA